MKCITVSELPITRLFPRPHYRTATYITDRFLPDKAIDLVDEAASALRLQQESRLDEIQELDRAILTLRIELESLRKEEDVASKERRNKLEAILKEKKAMVEGLTKVWEEEKAGLQAIKNTKGELEHARVELEICRREANFEKASMLQYARVLEPEAKLPKDGEASEGSLIHDSVGLDDISHVVSKATGIPTTNLMSGEAEKLVHLQDALRQSVRGQDDALKAVADAVRLQRAGLAMDHRPTASFMFLGPTGVGKTELCKALTVVIRFDMSEFQEKHTVSRLIGSPAGYIGYEDAGQLTEAVRRKPHAVLLFDEFEKACLISPMGEAHKDISSLLLQVLDEGFLTDAQGRKVDFRSTIIVLTSNLGQDILINDPSSDIALSRAAKQQVMDIAQHFYPPEFLNRIDEFIIFRRLSKGAIRDIVDIRLKELQEKLDDRRIKLDIDVKAKDWLSEKGYDVRYGARPLNRLIGKKSLNPLAERLIRGEIRNSEVARIRVAPAGTELKFSQITIPLLPPISIKN
ncbi:unnamed protein product [Tuber aestivum]|uniref:Clp ATPase C-terminal domain-containing protein n=1 Tax=Tuber aestivum TaxID=59557 RepID=A0A292Q5Q4_9PEZI|nr:unnamed protein product [Tuber aestivum]